MNAALFESIMRTLERPRSASHWYWESDGDRHARTFYCCHTQKHFTRVDCESRQDAIETAWILNASTP